MTEEKTVTDYSERLYHLLNEAIALGHEIPEERVVGKLLRSLTPKFETKATAMEEAKDLSKLKLEEAIGSLKTYEMGMNAK